MLKTFLLALHKSDKTTNLGKYDRLDNIGLEICISTFTIQCDYTDTYRRTATIITSHSLLEMSKFTLPHFYYILYIEKHSYFVIIIIFFIYFII